MGNADISTPISEISSIAVKGAAAKSGTVWTRSAWWRWSSAKPKDFIFHMFLVLIASLQSVFVAILKFTGYFEAPFIDALTDDRKYARLPLYSSTTHLHSLCSVPDAPVDSKANHYYQRKRLRFITPSAPFAERRIITMKIQLLLAVKDTGYAEHLSRILTEKYADIFEVIICSRPERLPELTSTRKFDVGLLSPEMAACARLESFRFPLLLWDGLGTLDKQSEGMKKLRCYQRISTLVGEILSAYAEISPARGYTGAVYARTTAVWSPIGGCGKTTAALAYAAQKVSEGNRTVYLDLQAFFDGTVYFQQTGKSISTILGKLDKDVGLMLQGIRQQDNDSGIWYFCRPDNYDDISILTPAEVLRLIEGCAEGADEVVVDLSSTYNETVRKILESVDEVLLVVDASQTGRAKWEQFQRQHDLFEKIRGKMLLAANRGARPEPSQTVKQVVLPYVHSEDPVVVYKTLSTGIFK